MKRKKHSLRRFIPKTNRLMWRDAYRKAVLNVKEGKTENNHAEKKSVTDSQRVVDLSENNERL